VSIQIIDDLRHDEAAFLTCKEHLGHAYSEKKANVASFEGIGICVNGTYQGLNVAPCCCA
jgi:hypothetical protein